MDLEQIIQQWESLENYLRKSDCSAVVRSTSEDVSGTNIENLISIAAQNTDTPLFVADQAFVHHGFDGAVEGLKTLIDIGFGMYSGQHAAGA